MSAQESARKAIETMRDIDAADDAVNAEAFSAIAGDYGPVVAGVVVLVLGVIGAFGLAVRHGKALGRQGALGNH